MFRTEFEALPPGPAPICVDALGPFDVSFLSHKGARPLLIASAYDCGSPGELLIRGLGNAPGADLRNDCTLQKMVLAVLPRSQAKGTRSAVLADCPTSRTTSG